MVRRWRSYRSNDLSLRMWLCFLSLPVAAETSTETLLLKWDIKVEVNLRPTVSRPVCPGVRSTSGTRDQFFFLLEISFR
jgi:hypothetical protein